MGMLKLQHSELPEENHDYNLQFEGLRKTRKRRNIAISRKK
jgi:hypothetical protein